MSGPKTITCRWCIWKTAAVYQGKDGKPKSGFARLRNHQEDQHPDELKALILTVLGEPDRAVSTTLDNPPEPVR